MGLFWSGATPVFSSVPCPMTRLLKTVTHAQTLLKMQKFPLTGKVLKLQIFPPAGNSGPYKQKNGDGIMVIPPPRFLRRAYAVSCRETKNPNPLPMANRFGFLDFGGDKRDRTADLLNAIQALSQTHRLHTPVTGSARCASIRNTIKTSHSFLLLLIISYLKVHSKPIILW